MTGDTGRFGMRASQGKVALLGMVEVFAAPGRGRMAICAGRSESTGMGIIDRMTGAAILRRALVLLGDMAPRTAGRLVCAGQRIFRLLVIESSRSPTTLFVTLAAIIDHRVAVFVVLTMTGNTIAGGVSLGNFGQVTAFACDRRVATEQGIIRQRMVEGRFAQATDVRVATHVVGMAASTLAIERQRVAAMKALLPLDVVGYQFVTGQAQPALRITFEGLMAGTAIRLELCVPFDQLSWHHHTFPIDRA